MVRAIDEIVQNRGAFRDTAACVCVREYVCECVDLFAVAVTFPAVNLLAIKDFNLIICIKRIVCR